MAAGSRPGGLVVRRVAARFLFAGIVAAAAAPPLGPAGSPPHGWIASRVPARSVWQGVTGRAFAAQVPGSAGANPVGFTVRRVPARSVWQGIIGRPAPATPPVVLSRPQVTTTRPAGGLWGGIAGTQKIFPAGSQPGGVVKRRPQARAVVGSSGFNAGGEAAPGYPNGSPPGGLVAQRLAGQRPRLVTGHAVAAAHINGSRPGGRAVVSRGPARAVVSYVYGAPAPQPPGPAGDLPNGLTVNRAPARSVWQGITGRPFTVQVPGSAGANPVGLTVRRVPARSLWQGVTGRAAPATPQAVARPQIATRRPVTALWGGSARGTVHLPPAGSVQPHPVVARRAAARAVVAALAVPGRRSAPATGGLVKRRGPARAFWAGSTVRDLGPFPPPSGSQPGGQVARRGPARAVASSVYGAAPAPPLGPAGGQPRGLTINRTPARSVWQGITGPAPVLPPPPGLAGSNPVGLTISRVPARSLWQGITGRPAVPASPPVARPQVTTRRLAGGLWGGLPGSARIFPAGSRPGGLVTRRAPARAEVGPGLRNAGGVTATAHLNGAPAGGLAAQRQAGQRPRGLWAGSATRNLGAFPPPSGSRPGGVIMRRRPAGAVTGHVYGAPAPPPSGPAGSAPVGLVINRVPARSLWQGVAGQPFTTQVFGSAGSNPVGFTVSRVPARFLWQGVTGQPAVPVAPPLARPQVATRRPVTGLWGGIAVPGQYSAPATGGLVARRAPYRAEVGASLLNAGGEVAPGYVPGSPPGGLVAQRIAGQRPRLVTGQSAGTVAILPAGSLPPNFFVGRRASARAYWAGTSAAGNLHPFVPPVVFPQGRWTVAPAHPARWGVGPASPAHITITVA
jgi:hypothetical protein